uniref:Glucuronosyltransferase n=1 Tax=Acrobeloides nanus TaxID=290746 RepID=A0A914ED57_9BILA
MVPLIKWLSKSGHDISVLEANTNPKTRNLGPNITIIHIYIPTSQGIAIQFAKRMWTGTIHSPDIHTLYKVGNNVAKDFLRDHSEKIVKILDEKWDLIVADELFAIHSYAIATFFKGREDIPYITMSTSIMNPPAAERLALGRNIGSTPYVATWVPKKDDEKHEPTLFWQRLYNAIESVIEIFAVNTYSM